MLHKIRNISGTSITIGSIVLVNNDELSFFDSDKNEINNVEDLLTSITGTSNNLNEYFLNSRVEYSEDNVVKTNDEFYSFWNNFANVVYPELINLIPISRKSINENIDGLDYDNDSGTIELETDRVILTQNDQDRINQTFSWGNHSTVGYAGGVISPDFASVSNTNTSTNINVSSPGVLVPITGTINEISDNMEINGSGIRVTRGGLVFCSATVYFSSTVQRPNLNLSFEIDGVVQPSRFAHGYIRSTGGHNSASITMAQWLRVSNNQTIYIRSVQESATGTVTMNNNNSIFQIYSPVNNVARGEKGDKGDSGQPAFNFLDGLGIPVPTLGSIGDIYINKENNDFYRKNDTNTWLYLTTLSSSFGNDKSIIPMWAEESIGLTNNNRQWSFGNGAVGNIGLTIPFRSNVIATSYHCDVAGNADTLVNMTVNNNSTPININKTPNSSSGFESYINNPYLINTGDVIGFNTITAGSASNVRVCVWLLIDNDEALSINPSSNIPTITTEQYYVNERTTDGVRSPIFYNGVASYSATGLNSGAIPYIVPFDGIITSVVCNVSEYNLQQQPSATNSTSIALEFFDLSWNNNGTSLGEFAVNIGDDVQNITGWQSIGLNGQGDNITTVLNIPVTKGTKLGLAQVNKNSSTQPRFIGSSIFSFTIEENV